MKKRVFVGMSGGVDSSVSALLLQEQGFEVTGVFMKNWAQDIGDFACPWEQDLVDADAVAAQLGIELKVYDFQKQYRKAVVDYMIAGYQAGETPNPDIMCNQEIKFKLFLSTALSEGADFVATGHYARIEGGKLLMAKDKSKDQSYFLARIDSRVLDKVIFPLGNLTKQEVRKLAKQNNLVTAAKKDSVGICFVGQVGVRDFLGQFVDSQPGNIIDQAGKVVGEHDGAIFYTIGQRHGLGVGGGLPYYVTGKDMARNIVYVTTDLDDQKLWSNQLKLADFHWLNPDANREGLKLRARYQSPLVDVELTNKKNSTVVAKLTQALKAAAPGQSAVFYSGQELVASGIISPV